MTSLGVANFKQMQDEVLGMLQKESSTATRTTVKSAMNRVYDEVVHAHEWPELQRVDYTGLRVAGGSLTTLVSGDPHIVAPWNAERITGLQAFDTCSRRLDIVERDEFFAYVGSGEERTGTPEVVTQVGVTAQFRTISTVGTMTLKCSVSGNDNISTVRVYYTPSDAHLGRPRWMDVSGAFSSGVALGINPAAGYSIERVSVPAGWVGVLTIEDASNVAYVELDPVEVPGTTSNDNYQVYSRPLFRVAPIPDANYKAAWSWKHLPDRLTENEDVPEIPVSTYLVEMTVAKMLMEDRKWQVSSFHRGEAEAFLRRLTSGQQRSLRVVRPVGGNVANLNGFFDRRPYR